MPGNCASSTKNGAEASSPGQTRFHAGKISPGRGLRKLPLQGSGRRLTDLRRRRCCSTSRIRPPVEDHFRLDGDSSIREILGLAERGAAHFVYNRVGDNDPIYAVAAGTSDTHTRKGSGNAQSDPVGTAGPTLRPSAVSRHDAQMTGMAQDEAAGLPPRGNFANTTWPSAA